MSGPKSGSSCRYFATREFFASLVEVDIKQWTSLGDWFWLSSGKRYAAAEIE
jgi:hypothetical protein